MASVLETLAIKLVLDGADFAKGMSQAEDTMVKAGRNMVSAGQRLTLGVTTPLVGIAVAALKTSADFERNMNQMQVVAGATGDEMKSLSAQALQLGKDTSFSALDAADAMLELSKAGLKVADVSAAIPGVLDLAAAGGLGLAKAAEISANAVNSFGLEAKETTRIANMFAAAANASSVEVTDIALSFQQASAVWAVAGQDANSLTAAIAMLGNAGIKASDAGTSLKQMMLSLIAPSSNKAIDAIRDYNVQVFDANGKTRNFRDILISLEQGLGKSGEKIITVGGVTEKLVDAMEKAPSKVALFTTKIAEQESELAILQSELSATIEKYGESSTQVDRKRLAIEKLTNRIAENRDELAGFQGTVDAYNSALENGKSVTVATTEAMRAHALAAIFGSDAMRAAAIMATQGVSTYDAMIAVTNDGTAASEVATAKMKGLAGAFEYFQGTVETVMIQAGTPWLDQVGQMIRSAADLIAKFGELPEPVQRGVVIFGALLAALGPVLIIAGSLVTAVGTIMGAFAGLSPVLAAVASPLGLAATAAAVAVVHFSGLGTVLLDLGRYFLAVVQGGDYMNDWITHLPESIQGVVRSVGLFVSNLHYLALYLAAVVQGGDYLNDWITHLSEPIRGVVRDIGHMIAIVRDWAVGNGLAITEISATWESLRGNAVTLFGQTIAAVQMNLPIWIATLAGWRDAAWQWVVDAAPIAVAKAGEYAGHLLKFLGDKLPDLLATMLRYATCLVEWITNSEKESTDRFGVWVANILKWGISEGLPQFINMTAEFAWALLKWISVDLIPKVGPELVKFGLAIAEGISTIAMSITIAALTIGVGIVEGIIQGIKNGTSALIAAATDMAKGALEAAKSALGIASPSKEGIAVGDNFGKSIGTGTKGALRELSADLAGRLNGMVGALNSNISLSGAGAGGVTITLTQYFTGNVDGPTVATSSRDGVLAALRQAGYA